METLVYVLGFIIGALGTSFLLYHLRMRKLLHTQHKLIVDGTLLMASMAKELSDLKESNKKEASKDTSCNDSDKVKEE